jgi:hypothetical protein
VRTPGRAGFRLKNPRYPPSRLSETVFAALFLAGIAGGAVEYARRSPRVERHVAGTNAITVHVLLAVAAAVAVISIQARRSRRPALPGPSPWAAPFSAGALARLRRTIRAARKPSMPNLARVIATLPLVLVLLYMPFRMGAQITGGLDPNATINAWGGPTYLGALLAHWLDCIMAFYVAAFLLNRLLLPAPAEDPASSATTPWPVH